MGYRGEDVSAAHGDWGSQTPWQPSSGAAPGNAGAWGDRSQDYRGDENYENYPPVDGGFGYGPDAGYPGQGQQGQQGYGAHEGQYGDPYAQQPYDQHAGYGPEPAQGGAGGYLGPQGYAQHDDYGYEQGPAPSPGYGQGGYDQGGYDQRPAPGYGAGGGYQGPNEGYDLSPRYPASPAGGYSAPRGGTGGYLALPPGGSGGYPPEDAGNDWYGGQPAAAKGASFADTGTYALNGSVIDEYGTGPREAMRDPVRGYPPGPAQQGTGRLPVQPNPAASGPQTFPPTGSQSVTETRAQERYDDRAAYPEYGQGRPGGQPGRGASGGFQGPAGRDAYHDAGEYSEPDGYNEYEDEFNDPGAGDDPYQDRYDNGTGPRTTRGGGRGSKGASGGRAMLGPLRGKRLLLAAVGVVAVGIIGVAAYAFLFKPSSSTSNPNGQGSLSASGAEPSQQACEKQLGTYCHIEAAADDPTPLTTAGLFPTEFTNETDKTSYTLVSTKVDKTCANAVIGSPLIKALQTGKCTQVLRGSYISGNKAIMGTIGVVNLSTTNEAHDAGKVVGQNDFIAPLTSATGLASKLGNGTGVVEAEFKGHYLILTWSEFVNGTDPSTKAEDSQLEQFSSDLVSGTANVNLSQRMVTGAPSTAGAN